MAESDTTCTTVSFGVGDLFPTYEELETKVKAYETKAFVQFWKRDTRTIEASRKRIDSIYIKQALRYYELKYCCIHGGQAFKGKGNGSRCTS